MDELSVIDSPRTATAILDPVRASLLAELSEPLSAAALSSRTGITRQKVNYHLRLMESEGLTELVEERKWGGITERLQQAVASSFVISPSTLGDLAPDPLRDGDRLSASHMVAMAARTVREVGEQIGKAARAKKRLATFSLDTEIAFESPASFSDFTNELAEVTAELASRYHRPGSGALTHRVLGIVHQKPEGRQHGAS
ncbi:MAG: winged helix-turn-helix domain-containing protein [Solirubrobacterales bacterium]